MKRVLGYVRESTKDQAVNGYNIEEQARRIKKYFEIYFDQNEDTFEILSDGGYSAKNLNRPNIKKILNYAKSNKFDILIIHNLDRLTRRIKDLDELLELFSAHNISLISVTEKLDTGSAIGRFVVYMIGIIAQWERETISERTKRALKEAYMQKKCPLRFDAIPISYKKDKDKRLIIDEKYAPMMVDFFNTIATGGYNYKKTIAYLKSINYPRNKVNEETVKKILKCPFYVGEAHIRGTVIKDYCPPLITKELQDRAKRALMPNGDAVRRYSFTYYGKVVCTKCGNTLVHTIARGRGGLYYYYRCKCCEYNVNEKLIDKEIDSKFRMDGKIKKGYVRSKPKEKHQALLKYEKMLKKELYNKDRTDESNELVFDMIQLTSEAIKKLEEDIKKIELQYSDPKIQPNNYLDLTREERGDYFKENFKEIRITEVDKNRFIIDPKLKSKK